MTRNFKNQRYTSLLAVTFLSAVSVIPQLLAETPNTQNLSLVPPCIGCETAFTVSQAVGPSGSGSGVARNTYSGLFEWVLNGNVTGRLAPFSNVSRYGLFFDNTHVFQSFLTPRFLTIVSSNTTTCPAANADYNYLMIRGRSPNDLRAPMNASSATFVAGGSVSYIHAERAFDSLQAFSLSSATPRTISSWYEGVGGEGRTGAVGSIGASCSSGSQNIQGFGDMPWDSYATIFHGQNGFVTIGLGGNPSVFIGSPVVVLDNTRMNDFSNKVLSGFLDAWTGTPTRTSTIQKQIYFYPTAGTTSIELREVLSPTNPTATSLYGTLSCPSNQRNSPLNGFVRCSLTIVGESGSGNAVCMISQRGAQDLIACSAQFPSSNSVTVSMVGVAQGRSKLAITAPATNLSSLSPADITLTVQNVTGTPVINSISLPDPGLRLPSRYQVLTPTVGAEPNPSFNGTSPDCGASLGAYQSCNIRVRITPTSPQTYADTVRVRYDSGEGWQNATADLIVAVGATSLSITPSGPFAAGSSQQLTVTATYSDSSTQNVTAAVTWQTSNSSVLGISSTGLASFLAANSGLAGSASITASLGSLSASFTPVVNDSPPSTSLSAQAVRYAAGTSHQFTVTYTDGVAVDVSTLGNGDVRVTGPNGFNQTATLVGVDVAVNGSPRVATYSITAPGGTWDPDDDGTYTVSMEPSQVSDTAGNSIASGSIGTFVATPVINLGLQPGDGGGNPQLGMNIPRRGFADSTGMVVIADAANHRVLIWNSAPASNQQAPDVVVGQPNLTSTAANQGGAVAANTLSAPTEAIVSGSSLIVADSGNHRVLVYSPVPTTNNASASVVLGQPDMLSNQQNAGGSTAANTLRCPQGLWVDGGGRLYAADAANSRVLIWNSVPSVNQRSADLVLGQANMTSATSGTTASTFMGGSFFCNTALKDVSGDSSRLFVADTSNNRVLIWNTLPSSNGAAASLVVGQANMTSSTGGITASVMTSPQSVYSTGSQLFVADGGSRVLRWSSIPATNGASATSVLGQTSMTGLDTNFGSFTAFANSLSGPQGVFGTGSRLYVSDSANNRVLIWNSLPTANTASADLVLGQPNMNARYENSLQPTSSLLHSPVAFSDGTRLFVADRGFHRVLIWNSMPTQSTTPANIVLGQPNMTSGAANQGSLTPSASSMQNPSGLHYDGTRLFVADYDNNRVLIWNSLPTTNGQAADLVLGQANMTTNANGVSATTMSQPNSVFSDGTRLAVADMSNNRVLFYSSIPTTNGAAASFAFGQRSLTCRTANKANNALCASSNVTAGSLSAPEGVWSDGSGRWFVADTGNNRVLIFPNNPTANYPLATIIVGQTTATATQANRGGSVAANGLDWPSFVSISGTTMAIADSNNMRVLLFNSIPSSNGASATSVIGQPDLTSGSYTSSTHNTFAAPKSAVIGPSNRIWLGVGGIGGDRGRVLGIRQ